MVLLGHTSRQERQARESALGPARSLYRPGQWRAQHTPPVMDVIPPLRVDCLSPTYPVGFTSLLCHADNTDELKALRRAIGQIGGAVETIWGMFRVDEDQQGADDPDARATVDQVHEFLGEAKIALDKFDSLTTPSS